MVLSKVYSNIKNRIYTLYNYLFKYDLEIANKIFKQAYTGLNYLAIIATFGNIHFLIYDYLSEHYIGVYIRIVVIALCVSYFIFHKKLLSLPFDTSRWVICAFCILDIETQIRATDVPFYDPLTWAILPVLMIFHAFYFNGVPGKYFIFWLFLIIYYYFRVSLSDVSYFTDHKLMSVYFHLVSFWLFSSLFNLFWFKVRYTNISYLVEIETQTNKRIQTEKALAAQKERENILFNLHDHLGSAIVDLTMLTKSFSPSELPRKENIELMDSCLHKIEDNLKMQINTFQDRKILEDNFLQGISIVLYRRYAIYKRDLNIYLNDLETEKFPILKDPSKLWSLYSICMEISNNDLKYGIGKTIWNWSSKEADILELEIKSDTNYNYDRQFKGKGSETILKRLESMGGNLEVFPIKGKFHIKVFLGQNPKND